MSLTGILLVSDAKSATDRQFTCQWRKFLDWQVKYLSVTIKYFTDRQNTCQWHINYVKNVALTGKTPVRNQIEPLSVFLLTGSLPVSDLFLTSFFWKLWKNDALTGKKPVRNLDLQMVFLCLTGKLPVSTMKMLHWQAIYLSGKSKREGKREGKRERKQARTNAST